MNRSSDGVDVSRAARMVSDVSIQPSNSATSFSCRPPGSVQAVTSDRQRLRRWTFSVRSSDVPGCACALGRLHAANAVILAVCCMRLSSSTIARLDWRIVSNRFRRVRFADAVYCVRAGMEYWCSRDR